MVREKTLYSDEVDLLPLANDLVSTKRQSLELWIPKCSLCLSTIKVVETIALLHAKEKSLPQFFFWEIFY